MITTANLAWRLRKERGLLLPVKSAGEYSNPRLREIAIEQERLSADFARLDKEIETLAGAENAG